MKAPRIRRLATWRAHYLGLLPQDRPGGGVLVLDRNPWASVFERSNWLPPGLMWAAIALAAAMVCSAFGGRSPGRLGFPACMIGIVGLLTFEVIRRLFGREQLWIGERGLDYLWNEGLASKRREIPFAEIRRLTPYRVTVSGGKGQLSHPEYGLAIETIGRTLSVGQCRDSEAVEQLHEEFVRNLGEWCPAWVEAPERPDCEVLDAAATRPEPPSDSMLTCRREWHRTEFVPYGRAERVFAWSYRPLGWVLLLMPLVLVPMAVGIASITAGLIVAGWLGGMLLPVSVRRRWAVRPGEVTVSAKFWGLGWSRTIEIEWLKRLELRKVRSRLPWEPRFALALVDLDDEDKAVFGPLTEGEARWMAGIVADVLRDALPRSGQEVYRWSVSVDEPTAGSREMADAWLDDPGQTKSTA